MLMFLFSKDPLILLCLCQSGSGSQRGAACCRDTITESLEINQQPLTITTNQTCLFLFIHIHICVYVVFVCDIEKQREKGKQI